MRLGEARQIVSEASGRKPMSYQIANVSRPFGARFKGKGIWTGAWLSQGSKVQLYELADGTKGADQVGLVGLLIDNLAIRLQPTARGVKQADGSWRDVTSPPEMSRDEVLGMIRSYAEANPDSENIKFFFLPTRTFKGGFGDPRSGAKKIVRWNIRLEQFETWNRYSWKKVSIPQIQQRVFKSAFCFYGPTKRLLPFTPAWR